MELKKGYKQTDIGILPNEWETPTIEEACELINGRGFKPFEWKDQGLPIIRIQNLNGSDEYNYYLGKFDTKIEVENGQLLFAWSGSRGTSFGPHIWDGSKGLLNYHTWKININEKVIDKRYFLHALKQLTKFIEGQAHGASALVHVQKWEMEKFKFPVPTSKVEQSNIGLALDDLDDLINSLSTLIEKKKAIKQGAMQQLLKPKERWGVLPFDKVVWFQEGPGVRNHQFTTSGVKLLNGTNIEKGKLILEKTDRYISKHEAYGWYKHFLADAGDIIIACSGVSIDKFDEKVTIVEEQHLPLCMNTSTMRFKIITDKLDKNYFYHFLKSNSFKEQIGGKATGSAQLNFGPSHVKNVQINLPPTETEQIEISSILSDIELEIDELEQTFSKYQMVKQGVMQELLTGKTRLL